MKPHASIFACLLMLLTSACSSIIEGRSQTISLNTNPPGADCALNREGMVIGRINPTPGSVVVEKTKHDILITCAKPGYQTATYHNHSGVAGATFGNIVLGGAIGWAIDSATGADNKYDSPVNLTMVPEVAVQSPTAQAPALVPAPALLPAASAAVAPAALVAAAPAAAPTANQACRWNPQQYRYECW
jgi:hypothetical protein